MPGAVPPTPSAFFSRSNPSLVCEAAGAWTSVKSGSVLWSEARRNGGESGAQ
ncbi:MAG: hypothetical protein JWM13_581 [Arthrobacter sp.]|jgi:hypothetical protein|nr:hypothetical protein [Arthrobacter sp.]MCU1553095.1 hypothetical protein [Arthrobacter sp.]